MNELDKRFLEEGSAASETMRRLLESAVREDEPPAGLAERLEVKLGPVLELPHGGPAPVTPATPNAGVGSGISAVHGGAKWVALALVGGLAVTGGAAHFIARPVATPSPMAPPAPAAASPGPSLRPTSPPSESEPRSPAPVAKPAAETTAARRSTRAAQPAAQDQGIDAETALLSRAHAALLRKSPARALGLTEEHRRRFPLGTFAQEREMIAIEALLDLGRRASAHERALRFRADYPGSGHQPRLQQLLEEHRP